MYDPISFVRLCYDQRSGKDLSGCTISIRTGRQRNAEVVDIKVPKAVKSKGAFTLGALPDAERQYYANDQEYTY